MHIDIWYNPLQRHEFSWAARTSGIEHITTDHKNITDASFFVCSSLHRRPLLVHGTSLQARFQGLLSKSLWEQESSRSSNVDQLSSIFLLLLRSSFSGALSSAFSVFLLAEILSHLSSLLLMADEAFRWCSAWRSLCRFSRAAAEDQIALHIVHSINPNLLFGLARSHLL
jgi:hypothetical protein